MKTTLIIVSISISVYFTLLVPLFDVLATGKANVEHALTHGEIKGK